MLEFALGFSPGSLQKAKVEDESDADGSGSPRKTIHTFDGRLTLGVEMYGILSAPMQVQFPCILPALVAPLAKMCEFVGNGGDDNTVNALLALVHTVRVLLCPPEQHQEEEQDGELLSSEKQAMQLQDEICEANRAMFLETASLQTRSISASSADEEGTGSGGTGNTNYPWQRWFVLTLKACVSAAQGRAGELSMRLLAIRVCVLDVLSVFGIDQIFKGGQGGWSFLHELRALLHPSAMIGTMLLGQDLGLGKMHDVADEAKKGGLSTSEDDPASAVEGQDLRYLIGRMLFTSSTKINALGWEASNSGSTSVTENDDVRKAFWANVIYLCCLASDALLIGRRDVFLPYKKTEDESNGDGYTQGLLTLWAFALPHMEGAHKITPKIAPTSSSSLPSSSSSSSSTQKRAKTRSPTARLLIQAGKERERRRKLEKEKQLAEERGRGAAERRALLLRYRLQCGIGLSPVARRVVSCTPRLPGLSSKI